MRSKLVLSIALLVVPMVACDDGDSSGASSEGSSSGSTATSSSAGGSGGDEAKPVTEKGYEVVMAESDKRKGPKPSTPGGDDDQRDDLVMEPTKPDPHGGEFTLESAVEGMKVDGQLVAEMDTQLGTLFCDLFAEKRRKAVANFIGLARGKRKWWDARGGAWVAERYYDGTEFHRVLPEYIIQGGDYLGDGTGVVGYELAKDNEPAMTHDEAGLLAMADHAAQFLITDGPAPKLDRQEGNYTIFGECQPVEVVHRIARVPQTGRPHHRPETPVTIERILIRRVKGGADKADPTPPKKRRREGIPRQATDESGQYPEKGPRGATPGPSELRQPGHPERQNKQQ